MLPCAHLVHFVSLASESDPLWFRCIALYVRKLYVRQLLEDGEGVSVSMTFGQTHLMGTFTTADATILKWHPIYIEPERKSIALYNRGGIPADGLRHRVRVFGRVSA